MSESTQPSLPRRWLKRFRWLLSCTLVGLFLTLLVQNLDPVEFRLLWMTVSMPRAVMLLTAAFLGFVLGALWSRSPST